MTSSLYKAGCIHSLSCRPALPKHLHTNSRVISVIDILLFLFQLECLYFWKHLCRYHNLGINFIAAEQKDYCSVVMCNYRSLSVSAQQERVIALQGTAHKWESLTGLREPVKGMMKPLLHLDLQGQEKGCLTEAVLGRERARSGTLPCLCLPSFRFLWCWSFTRKETQREGGEPKCLLVWVIGASRHQTE